MIVLGESNFYRPQTKFAKAMISQVSVCPKGGVRGRGPCVAGGVCGRRGMRGRGPCVAGGACVAGQILREMVNEWAVRILLECILVGSTSAFRLVFTACK